ncbi:MAG: hypothetical protein LBR09_03260 [Endomicrobium sp.]|jgi:hypothetical protein|nr:hypothetical protein [Endomicrobium sp.]
MKNTKLKKITTALILFQLIGCAKQRDIISENDKTFEQYTGENTSFWNTIAIFVGIPTLIGLLICLGCKLLAKGEPIAKREPTIESIRLAIEKEPVIIKLRGLEDHKLVHLKEKLDADGIQQAIKGQFDNQRLKAKSVPRGEIKRQIETVNKGISENVNIIRGIISKKGEFTDTALRVAFYGLVNNYIIKAFLEYRQ